MEAKAIEGMGEAGPQLFLQAYIFTYTMMFDDGTESTYGLERSNFYRTKCKYEKYRVTDQENECFTAQLLRHEWEKSL